ncbi:endonuclease NucS [Halococcus sp. PRR34]|uniref:endonuclease NucS n=1 Tax=Halococcus sp. PRR34 TaxID=3020830 RepID=UPI0023601AD4|nr:endonuclease NucS [Halococcus sp. PRR34]
MPVSSVTNPTAEDALKRVESGFKQNAMLTLVGRCEVDYDGRASSYLPPGERLVILKPDGTLLVHRTEQRTPVNWQPPGCTHTAHLDDDQLIVHSTRSTPSEEVTITFETVLQLSIMELDDSPDLVLEGSEEDLRQRILTEPDILEKGFTPQMTERETAAGAVDIYGKDADDVPTVVELKRRRVGPDAVSQLHRYVDALDRELPVERSIRGILVAPSVTDRAERLLAEENLEFVELDPATSGDSTVTQLTEFSTNSNSPQ